jgi:hypothetical protein
VPAKHDGAVVAIVEATSQDLFVRAWIGLLLEGAAADAPLRAGHTKHFASADLSGAGEWSIRRGSVE